MTTVQAETAIPTGVWRSDPVHSHVGFSVRHMVVATFRGTSRISTSRSRTGTVPRAVRGRADGERPGCR